VYTFVLILSVLTASLLMVVILMQASKGGGLSATFGGGGGDSMLSTRQAATVLHRLTIYLVAGFMLLCLVATMISSGSRGTVARPVTAGALEQQAVSSGFNASIPVVPELPGTAATDEE
jgi:preprotein translocase subunit SecG